MGMGVKPDGAVVPERLHNIWDVYNQIKARRDFLRELVEVVKRGRNWDEPLLNALSQQEKWSTDMLRAIDVAQGRPTEDD